MTALAAPRSARAAALAAGVLLVGLAAAPPQEPGELAVGASVDGRLAAEPVGAP